MSSSTATSRLAAAATLLALGFCAGWWRVGAMLIERWAEPQYSFGWIIPGLAIALAWSIRGDIRRDELLPQPAGLALIAFAMGLEGLGLWTGIDFLAAVSIVPAVAGICFLIGGWPLLKPLAPAVLFLAFAAPLPWFVESTLSRLLQSVAAEASAACLQACGVAAAAHGSVLEIPTTTLGIAEACSGLRMASVLVALITAMTLFSRRPRAMSAFLILSALPISVVCNVARITATALYLETAGRSATVESIHDLAGWLMPPLAMVLFQLELRLLDGLLTPVPHGGDLSLAGAERT